MPEIIDLSMEIYSGMPVHKSLLDVKMDIHATHEEWEGIKNAETKTSSVLKLEMSEHTGTHVDSISHMGLAYQGQSIDTMPLTMFYTRGLCLDFSHKHAGELIEPQEIEDACKKANVDITKGSTVLFYTDHYRKCFNTDQWGHGPGLSAAAAVYLGNHQIAAFGVETMSPGISKVSNKEVHRICGEMGFTHYENMINLHQLIGRGYFRFIAFPLKIKGGTGSPVRAVAIFGDE